MRARQEQHWPYSRPRCREEMSLARRGRSLAATRATLTSEKRMTFNPLRPLTFRAMKSLKSTGTGAAWDRHVWSLNFGIEARYPLLLLYEKE